MTHPRPPRPLPSSAPVAAAYDEVAELYASLFADAMEADTADRRRTERLADAVPAGGLLVDVGCGPGHVTAHLAARAAGSGIRFRGIDPSPSMIEIARRRSPELDFRLGHAEALDLEPGTVDALLARYSLIHLPPDALPEVFAGFHRVLTPGGRLLVSFFGADERTGHGEPFDHKATTAHRLSAEVVADQLRATGFDDVKIRSRPPEAGERFLQVSIGAAVAGD